MENVIISNQVEFEKKKEKFKKGGVSSVHVVSDFDRTLTKAYDNDKKVGTAIAQIRNNNYLSSEYTKKAFELFDKYHPIEIDPNLTMEKKIPLMEEWWSKHLKLIVKSCLKKEIIDDVVEKDYLPKREGLEQLMSFLKAKKIPILILSSGLGDVIGGFFEKKKVLTANVHVISNYFDFDEKGFAKGYKGKIIHVFNKDESQIKDMPYFKKISKRKNVILMGDSIGDLKMPGQIPFDEILRVCFFNEQDWQKIDEFKKHFDVLILNDGPLDFVNDLLKELFE